MTEQTSISRRAWAEILLLGLIWGGSFLSIRIALDDLPVMTSVAHRVVWAALALWVIAFARGLPLPREPRLWGALLVMGLLNNVVPFSLMAWGQLHISSGLTSIFNAATAIFGVVVAAAVFADERLTKRKGVGVLLGFAGVVTAIGWDAFAQFDIRSLAQIAVLAGTLSYAFAGAWARAQLRGLSPIVAAAGMLTASTLVMVPAALWIDGPTSLRMAPDTALAVAYYALIATAWAYMLYYRVLAMAGAGNLLLVTLVIPPVAITLGALVRAERLELQAFAGFALLAAGLFVLNRRPLPKMPAAR